MIQVYLAGPINGTFYTKETDWRSQATAELKFQSNVSINVLSPMRGKDEFDGKLIDEVTNHDPIELVGRDYSDIRRSDIILCNIPKNDKDKISIGTCAELGIAYERRIPVVLVCDWWFKDHPFVKVFCQYKVSNLQDGITKIFDVLGL